MNDLLDPTAVEERLRRTLAVRAEDMAPGDRTPATLSDFVPPDAVAAALAGVRSTRRRLSVTVAVAAAAVAVVAGAAGSALWLGDRDAPVVSSEEPEGAGVPPDDTVPPPTTSAAVGLGYGIAQFEGEGFTVHVQFDAGVGEEAIPDTGFWEEVTAGPNRGFYAALPNGAIGEVRLIFDDGTVVISAGAAPREELLAAGATVHLDPATGLYTLTPPPGWTTLWMTTPEVLAGRAEEESAATLPASLGFFVCGDKTYGVTWYAGWTDGQIPDGSKQVTAGDGEAAYFGTIAPAAGDLFQVWIVYTDGVVELQGAVMTEDELVAAADGIERLAGDEFRVTPPPCFTPQG